jgi:hypothetical protein
MYGWLWGRLPGGTAAKAAVMLLLAVAVFSVLWFWLFPWIYTTFPV